MESGWERVGRELARELEAAHETLRQSEQLLAVEVEAAQRLQQIATQLITAQGTEALYEQILDTTQSLLRADFASIQMFYPERGAKGELLLLGHRGFSAPAAKRWEWVTSSTRTTCGEALRTGQRIIVPDVRTCDFLAGSEDLEGYLGEGIRAAQTSPLISRSAALLGMVTTYWREPHELSASELRSLDVLARLAADLIERSQVEEALGQSHQRLASIYDTVRDVIFYVAVEPEGKYRFVSVNAAFLRVTGLSREMIVSKTLDEVIPEPSLTVVLDKYRQAIEKKTTVLWEETSDYPTGRLTGEVSIAAVFDGKGACTHLVGSVHDITERKAAEAALRESEERLRFVQSGARLGLWDCDLRTMITTISEEYANLYGLPSDQHSLTDEEWGRLIHPDDRERVAALMRESLTQTRVWDAEFRVLWPDGTVHWLLGAGTVFLDDSGQPVRLAGVNLDITGRKQAETALSESEERLRSAVHLTHVGHWNRDLRTNRISWSEETCRIYGKPAGYEPSYEEFLQAVLPQDRERVDRAVKDYLAGEREYSLEFQIVRPSGEVRTVASRAEVSEFDQGLPVRMFGAVQDITDLRQAQEQRFAVQKLESLGTLASGIAHDFNNLLGAVLAHAELAQEELAAGSSPEQGLQVIRDLAIRGSEIVRELMVYAGKESDVLGLVDVSQVVEDVLELLKISISKHATLQTDFGQHLPTVRAGAAQMLQLVMNLAMNASEAIGDRDGVIRVSTRRAMVKQGSREIERLVEGEYVQLEVSDTGCGISPETQARIFDPFFSTKSAGRGLGLAVVHGIVRDLGGAINLASEPGHGTTFQILLPGAETTSGRRHGAISDIGQPAQTAQATTILLVEDEDPLRQAVSRLLGNQGFTVIEAGDGSAALEAIRGQKNPIHVLFLDTTLPGASGREVLQEARRLRPGMRVILTSAYTEEMVRASLQSTIGRFVRKPYRFGDLVQLIRSNPPEPLATRQGYD